MPLTFKPLGNASAKMRAHEHTARRESFRVPVENLRGLILAGSLLSGYASGACTLPAEPVVPAIAGKVNTHASINASSDTNVTVSVLSIAPRVAAIIKAQRVTLRQGSKVYTLAEVGNQYMLTAPEGWYTLEVTVNHLHVPSRQVEVRGKSQSITVFATDPDNKLYFRAGEQLVPFRPLARYQSIVFEYHVPSRGSVTSYLSSTALQPLQLELEATSHVPFSASWPAPSTGNAYIVSSRNPQLAWTGIVADLRTALTKQYPNADVRVGVPVDTGGGEFQALDRRFFVRFARGVTYAERSDWQRARHVRSGYSTTICCGSSLLATTTGKTCAKSSKRSRRVCFRSVSPTCCCNLLPRVRCLTTGRTIPHTASFRSTAAASRSRPAPRTRYRESAMRGTCWRRGLTLAADSLAILRRRAGATRAIGATWC
jgi:hypothetical protein